VIDGNPKSTTFLTVPELADLLHVNEKKIYKLAGEGDIPGTKITGKWIFPRHLIEDWISENSHGGAMTDRLIITGSDDRFIEHICSQTAKDLQQTSFLSYSPCGTRHGLRMLDMRRADACFINWGASDSTSRRHLGLLRSYKNHQSWVVVRCLQRNQGLILSRSIATETKDANSLLNNTKLRWAKRDSDAGAERLLEDICASTGLPYEQLQSATVSNTERAAVAKVNTGSADIACGTECIAHEFQLPFIPLAKVSLDLVMSRRTYFRTLTQELLNRLINGNACSLAKELKGYSVVPKHEVVTID